jgi:peptide/nickel transport system permease protein
MFKYIIRRLLQALVVVFMISLLTFIIMRLVPGDPVSLLLGEGQIQITQEQVDAIRAKWGLDQPYHIQYLTWIGNFLRGDLGTSLVRRGVPVRDMILEAVPVTAQLNIYALILALLFSLPAGIIAGVKRNSLFDYITAATATLGVAIPNFWLGLMLIMTVAVSIPALPVFGLKTWHGYILPVIVVAIGQMAVITRVMRGSIIEVLEEDYIRTAQAKGLRHWTVVVRHAVRNALLPVVTVIGFQIAFILSGTIVVEQVFALPGVGRLFVDSVFRLDYQVVQSLVMILAILVVITNLLTDLVYAVVDPRIRYN